MATGLTLYDAIVMGSVKPSLPPLIRDLRAKQRAWDNQGDTMLKISYPFPLRSDFVAELVLPDNLTREEAERVCTYVRSLAQDDDMPSFVRGPEDWLKKGD